MPGYIQLTFQPVSSHQSDMLIAKLGEIGFEGFEEGNGQLLAFAPEMEYDQNKVVPIAEAMQVSFISAPVPEQNWNQVWESNFDPVIVDDFVAVRAAFHSPIMTVEHEIVITPKMSFGTGHHATTFMMMQQMRGLDFRGRSVFDFGTGTAVLAILAARLGASDIYAIDHDQWSIDNSVENIGANNVAGIRLEKKDHAGGEDRFDIILANINKNIILDNMDALAGRLMPGGDLLLSGLLIADEQDILAAAAKKGLKKLARAERSGWICLLLTF